MLRGRSLAFAMAALALLLVACAPSGPSEEEQKAAAAAEAWSWLQETKATIDGKRAELSQLHEQLKSSDAAEELTAQITGVEGEIDALSDQFTSRLVGFINDQGITVGAELTEQQLGAIRMKSDEEIVVAREYIAKGGDYAKAIDIYKQALNFDPDNPALIAALENAQTQQYMTEERFAVVKKKMSKDDVRAAIGQVNLHNIKEYEDKGTVAWFYRKEDGGAAGVFFREKRKGQEDWQVYSADFDAVKAREEAE